MKKYQELNLSDLALVEKNLSECDKIMEQIETGVMYDETIAKSIPILAEKIFTARVLAANVKILMQLELKAEMEKDSNE